MTTYLIEGMTCGGCASAVGKAIKRAVPDIVAVVDYKNGTAKLDKTVEEEVIAKAVQEAGFGFKGRAPD